MQKSNFRRTLLAFLSGALIGGVIATWFGPRVIGWWAEPPAYIGVSCRPAIEWAFRQFGWIQVSGLIAGGVLALVLALTIFRRKPSELNP